MTEDQATICKECDKPVKPEPLNKWLGKEWGDKAGYEAEICLDCEQEKRTVFCAECGGELRGEG